MNSDQFKKITTELENRYSKNIGRFQSKLNSNPLMSYWYRPICVWKVRENLELSSSLIFQFPWWCVWARKGVCRVRPERDAFAFSWIEAGSTNTSHSYCWCSSFYLFPLYKPHTSCMCVYVYAEGESERGNMLFAGERRAELPLFILCVLQQKIIL